MGARCVSSRVFFFLIFCFAGVNGFEPGVVGTPQNFTRPIQTYVGSFATSRGEFLALMGDNSGQNWQNVWSASGNQTGMIVMSDHAKGWVTYMHSVVGSAFKYLLFGLYDTEEGPTVVIVS